MIFRQKYNLDYKPTYIIWLYELLDDCLLINSAYYNYTYVYITA